MKKIIILIAAIALTFGVAYADDVASTKHNLTDVANTYNYGTTPTDEVCVFCHTPHDADAAAPLWNRNMPATGGYTMYTSSTLDMTIAGAPAGVSLACLSCHDGTVAFDSLINEPGSGNDAITDAAWNAAANGGNQWLTAGAAALDQNLTNDHPVSITYDDTLDAENDFVALATVQASSVPLYGAGSDQVECGSCHNPHDDTNTPFLRISNAASALCTTCHNK